MPATKIIFFDIDGTLIDMQRKQISENTLKMLRQLQKNGIKICLATGRSPVALPKFEGIVFDAYLTFNGSLCYTETETISGNPIPTKDVRRIIRNAADLGRPVSVSTKDRLAANGVDEDLADYYAFAHLTLIPAADFEEVAKQDVYQIELGCREKDYPTILQGVSGAKIAAWWDRAVDVIPADGGKGVGIRNVLRYFHLDKSAAMAFGDGNNDIEMLQSVGTGIAMENASLRLKEIADAVCGHVAQDGVYHYCIENGLI